ncbi:methyl-CpG-binding domain-containing protein 13-like [Senna tora]|uniref:Methyl-CpG-binding domain-containing protein 13-like n=1 Tax=Senna tora TaxID=362788 RepID=A0A834SUP2_9FABA|nr:methyl-CpG-binding domain-containing protein 13-like [Senna tora]
MSSNSFQIFEAAEVVVLEDISCHLKMDKTNFEKSEATNKKIRSNLSSNSKEIIEKANEHPEWLPEGWTVDIKIRKSGGSKGAPYKIYIDPLNGYKFYSKPEPSSTAKRQKVKQSATKRQLFVGEESEKSSIGLSDAKEGHDVKVSSQSITASIPAVKMHSLEDAAANPLEINNKSDPADLQEKNYVSNVMEGADKKEHSSSSISKTKERLNMPHRFSKRLAGIDPNQAAAMNATGNLSFLNNRRTDHGLNSEAYVIKENKFYAGEIGKINAQENKFTKKNDHFPSRTSKRLAGFEPEITDSGKPPEYKSKNSIGGVSPKSRGSEGMPVEELANPASTYINSSGNDKSLRRSRRAKIPPKTNEQLEKLGDEQLDDEKSETQLSFAFHYSWSDPSVDFAIKSVTGVLPAKNTVDTEPVLVSKTDIVQKNNLTKSVNEGIDVKNPQDTSKNSKNTVDNQPVLVPETDMVQKNKLSESVTKGSNDNIPQIPRKSKNKKELSLPRRLSKRLAGHEPEVAPAERALEYAARKSCKDEPTATAITGNGASKHLGVGEETEFTLQASDCSKREVHGDYSSNDSEKSHEPQIVPNENLLKVEENKIELTHQSFNCSKISVHGESSNKSEKSHEAELLPSEQLQKVEAEKIDLRLQASDCFKISQNEESLNKSEKSLEAQIVPNEQLQKVEAEKSNERSEPHLSLPFGDTWSDPCFEFAFKTLTGALPEEEDAAADISRVMTPDVNGPPNKEFLGNVVEKCKADEVHDNLNQSQNCEDIDNVCQPSKQFLGHPKSMIYSTSCENAPTRDDGTNITNNLNEGESQHFGQPELCTSSTYCENSPKFASRQSYGDEINIMRDLFGESLPIGSVDMACEPSNQLLGVSELRTGSTSCENAPDMTKNLDEGQSLRMEAGNKSQFVQEEPSDRFGKVLEKESAPAEQPLLENQTRNQKSELQFSAPLMDSWTSDPCLEFAFKTLTGTLSIEENLAMQGCFQEPEKYRSQRDASSMLPDFGSPSFSQNDVSFHYNMEKPPPGQHSSMSSSILPPEKVNLDLGVEPDSNTHYSQCSKNFPDRAISANVLGGTPHPLHWRPPVQSPVWHRPRPVPSKLQPVRPQMRTMGVPGGTWTFHLWPLSRRRPPPGLAAAHTV